MARQRDGNDMSLVVYRIDDPVITSSHPEPRRMSLEGFSTCGPRLGGEGTHREDASQRCRRPRRVSLQPELSLKFLKRDGVAGFVHRGLGLGGVFGIFGGAESVEHRFRNDGRYPFAVDGEMSDDAMAGKLNRLLDGRAVDRKVTGRLAHTGKSRQRLLVEGYEARV
jgi:hypothetical protein